MPFLYIITSMFLLFSLCFVFWSRRRYTRLVRDLGADVRAWDVEDLTRRLVEEWGVGLEALFYDTTNFDTFLSSENPAKLAQRGHAKSKRTDLRIVGLALLVSWDFHIPLFSQVYEGNQNDSVTFSGVLDDLIARYQMFRGKCENITLVFDKGNNSTENFQELDNSPYHFIGSLVPSQHQDLLDLPLQKFHDLDEPAFAGVRAYSTEKEVFGRKRTIVITRSRALLRGQIRGIRQQLSKKLLALRDLQKRIARSHEPGWRGKPYTVASIEESRLDYLRPVHPGFSLGPGHAQTRATRDGLRHRRRGLPETQGAHFGQEDSVHRSHRFIGRANHLWLSRPTSHRASFRSEEHTS